MSTASSPAARTSLSLVILAVVAIAVVMGLILWVAGQVILLIFGGLILARILTAMIHSLEKRTGLSRGWAFGLVLLLLVALIGGVIVFFAARIATEADQITESIRTSWEKLQQTIDRYSWARQYVDSSSEKMPGVNGEWFRHIAGFFSTTFGVFGALVVLIFIGLFTAADPELYRRGLLHLVPLGYRARFAEVLDEASDGLKWWVLGQLFSMTVVGVATGVGLWLLGIPFAGTLGLLAGLLTFIPNFGPILSTVPAVLLALTSGPMTAVYVILLYIGVQAVESNLLTPLVQQRNVKLPPVLNVGVQVLMGLLFGVAGLITAAPLSLCLMILVKRFYVEDVLGDRMKSAEEEKHSDH